MIDCTKMRMAGKAIPPNIDWVRICRVMPCSSPLSRMMQFTSGSLRTGSPCIIVAAKGQRDVTTRLFLRKMKMELKLPLLALVNGDPYELKILSVYGCRSKNMFHGSVNLMKPYIEWLGIRPSDLDKYGILEQCRLPMTDGPGYQNWEGPAEGGFLNPGWVEELTLMVKMMQKAEIQALSSRSG